MPKDTFVAAVERNINQLFKTFYENTAFFITERDVQSYLYSLLINDSFLKTSSLVKNFSTPNIETPETLLVHADFPVEVTGMKGTKKMDIIVFPPNNVIDYSANLVNTIGIEIKFNRREPARKEKSNILDDVKKCSDFRQGYVLWLNYDREAKDAHLGAVEKEAENCGNVKFFYLDVCSIPPKTNVPNLT